MNIQNVDKVSVFLKDKHVGTIFQNRDGSTTFVYSSEWLRDGFSISPFLLPLEDKEFHCNDYLTGFMFGVFVDCLPDSWGQFLVDKYLATLGINPRDISPLQRLTLLGKDSLGALSFKPLFEHSKQTKIDDFDKVRQLIDELETKDKDFDEDLFDLYHKGSPTGGSRPKVNYKFNDGDYIVKFPAIYDSKNIGFEEFKMNELARKCGINVSDFKLVYSKVCKGYFATKRFDRVDGERLHVITLAGLFNLDPGLSQIHYKGFLQTVRVLCPEDLEETIKRMIFNYLIDNKDDHPRNFSFIYDEKNKRYRLSPFYDITSTPKISEHMMQVNGKDNPTVDDFVADVTAVGFDKEKFLKIYKELSKIIGKEL